MPVIAIVQIVFVGPITSATTSGLALGAIPIISIYGLVLRIGLIDYFHLQGQGCLTVENIHSGIRHRDIDITLAFAYGSDISVDR